MPETNWPELPAGPELDALVAERVLGWSNCHIGPTYRKAMGIPPEQLAKQPADRTINFPCHYYSQAIGCAWEVVETMEKRGFRLCLEHQVQSWVAFFATDDRTPYDDDSILQEAATVPLAVCRAALAALEVAPRGKANPENELTRLQAELATAHETIARLNRRCQSAERGLAAKLNPGPRTFGRILANSAAAMWGAWALDMARGILAGEITEDILENARQIVNETAHQSHIDMRNELFSLRIQCGLDLDTGLPIATEADNV